MGKAAKNKQSRAQDRARLIDIYAEIAGPILLRHFSPDCCINATRVATEVLRFFKQDAKPLVVRVTVHNSTMWRLLREQGLPESGFPPEWEAQGAWSVGVDGKVANDAGTQGYSAHVVAYTRGLLVDSAVAQFRRPLKGISVPDVIVAPVPPTFLAGQSTLLKKAGDCVVCYQLLPDEHGYENFPGWGWQFHEGNRRVAAEIIETMLQKMKKDSHEASPTVSTAR